jgi:hypothetical protein
MTDTLWSIYERCPRLQEPLLDFIPDELLQFKQLIRRDLRELGAAAAAQLEKTVAMLAGSILEAVLYCFLQGQKEYLSDQIKSEFSVDPLRKGLPDFVSVFNRFFVHRFFKIPDVAITSRDLIHASREVWELSREPDICGRAAREMLPLLDALLSRFADFVEARTKTPESSV